MFRYKYEGIFFINIQLIKYKNRLSRWWLVAQQALKSTQSTHCALVLFHNILYTCWKCAHLITVILWIFTGARLADVTVGATDLNPSVRGNMQISELRFDKCGFHPGPIPNGATYRFNCPPGTVTGRYLVVQLAGTNYLTLCEVTATGGEALISTYWGLAKIN